MKRTLILCLFLVLSETSGICATTFFPPLQPLGNNSMQDYNNSITSVPDPFARPVNSSYPDVSRIEQSLFGRTFENENISLRLSRIEKSMFSTTYSGSSDSQRIDNIISNFNQINKYPNISQNELSRLESRIFSQNFAQDNPQRRIERLEQQLFGAIQSGSLISRYEAIKMAAKSYNRNNLYNSGGIMQGGWKGLAANLGSSMLGGTMTGFTPPINPYSNYNYGANGLNNYYNTYANPYSGNSGIYRGMRTNRGLGGYSYHDCFNDFGTGTGVSILD